MVEMIIGTYFEMMIEVQSNGSHARDLENTECTGLFPVQIFFNFPCCSPFSPLLLYLSVITIFVKIEMFFSVPSCIQFFEHQFYWRKIKKNLEIRRFLLGSNSP